jgi:hypothetical protein
VENGPQPYKQSYHSKAYFEAQSGDYLHAIVTNDILIENINNVGF